MTGVFVLARVGQRQSRCYRILTDVSEAVRAATAYAKTF
jgi:hypothetical protein